MLISTIFVFKTYTNLVFYIIFVYILYLVCTNFLASGKGEQISKGIDYEQIMMEIK